MERQWAERLHATQRAATEEQVGLFGHLEGLPSRVE